MSAPAIEPAVPPLAADAITPVLQVDRRIIIGWSIGALGVGLLSNAVASLALYYFTAIMGISAVVAGNLLMAAKIYDSFFDPFVGHASDQLRHKSGRRRPFLLWGAALSAVSIVLVFAVPDRGDSLFNWAFVLVALLVFSTGYSIFNVPYMSMPAEMTDDYHERSVIHGWRVAFAMIGSTIAGTGSGLLLAALGHASDGPGSKVRNSADDYLVLALVYAVIIGATMFAAWWTTARARQTQRTKVTMAFRHQISSLLANRPFTTILIVKALQLIGIASSQSASLFMIVEVLGRSTGDLAWIGLPAIATGLIVTPMLTKASRVIGKRGGYILSALATGLGALSWVFAAPGDPVWTLAARGVLSGIGFSGNVLFAMSMLTDSIELDHHRTGMRREGTFIALYSFVEKFSSAIGPAIVGIALGYVGFNPRAKPTLESIESVRQATLVGIAYVPAICGVLAVVALAFYRLSEQDLANARQLGPAGSKPEEAP
jgi:GPH family glycoside/pentoside/hexuronide:cation symporter